MTQQAGYLANRTLTLQFAAAVVAGGAAWDLQSDYMYLDAVTNWDTPAVTVDTQGKNLVRYLAELSPANIVLDAHGHVAAGPNMADIVHQHELLGAPRNGVVGGFLYFPTLQADWTQYQDPVAGRTHPEVSWTAEILWGAGTLQHLGPDSRASGVWRPQDADNFHVDDPAQRLVNVGAYTSNAPGLTDLLTMLRSGQLLPGHMYTATIFINQCALSTQLIAQHTSTITAHAADVASGDLVWATLPEMVRVWRDQYGSQPTILQPPATDGGSPGPSCGDAGVCPALRVCCVAPMLCAGQCVPDCRVDAGTACPTQAPHCNGATGVCGP